MGRQVIKGCKNIPDVGVAIRSHGSKMADKMAKSPNGTKTTHAMFCEFTQHPSDIIKSQNDIGVMQLKIPRLKKHELASLRLTPTVQLAHYNGPPKLNPTYLPVVALSPEKTVQADTYRARARAWDATGLFHVHTGCSMCTQKINLSSGRVQPIFCPTRG